MSAAADNSGGAESARSTSAVATATKPAPERESKRLPPWNVVLLNDDDHSYEYVIKMLQELFGHELEKAFQIAKTVDSDGRAVCMTTHKEHAELKRDQVLGFGRDVLIASCQGSMSAIIEPAEFEGDEGQDGKGGGGEDRR